MLARWHVDHVDMQTRMAHAIVRVDVYIIYFYKGWVILLVFSVNINGLELISVYNHHVFFEPLHSFFRFRS